MIKKQLKKIIFLMGGLLSSTSFAHTGFHNDIYHPLSGIDHFLVILFIGLLMSVAGYYFYKK